MCRRSLAILLAGAVFALMPSLASAASFVEDDRITAFNTQPGDFFGQSVAVLGDAAVVCSPYRTENIYQSGECILYCRTYTATYTVVDGSGNSATGSGTAFVPLNQGGTSEPLELALEETPSGTRVSWTAVTGNPVYNVVQGGLHRITETGSAISLGDMVCIESASIDTSTAGLEQAALPLALVEYNDGARVSYGTESAAKPRAVSTGDCP